MSENTQSQKLSIVVLCYKAGESVRPFVDRMTTILDTLNIDWELILVGNYNKDDTEDRTPHVVTDIAASDTRIIGLAKEKQGMMGWDARCGLEAATGDIIGFTDGDNQFPPEDIARVYHLLIENNLDMAQTYRESRGDGFFRTLQSQSYNFIFRFLFPNSGVQDVNSKPKIMTSSLYSKMDLKSDDWFLDAEIVIQARRHKAKVADIPTAFLESSERKSFTKISTVFEFIYNLLKARAVEFFKA